MTRDPRQIPLFPLPNVVHFPATDLRLHIFEPRYRQLVEDLQRTPERERMIGMVLLKPGWDQSSSTAPDIYEPGTAGLLIKVDYLDDGRSNIVLRGQYRFQVQREFPSHPYRQALVAPLGEHRMPDRVPEVAELHGEIGQLLDSLRQRVGRRFPPTMDADAVRSASLAELVNTIAAGLDIPVESKLDLLMRELPERAERVLSILRSRGRVLDLLQPYHHLSSQPDLN